MASKRGYGQFCPVAQASELVAERWTPLVLRELFAGSRRFNDLRRGVPLMSPTLLSRRLGELCDAGVVRKREAADGRGSEYVLTDAGEDLRPIIESLGRWGHRWARDLKRGDLDPSLLMWDVRRRLRNGRVPGEARRVVLFEFSDVARKLSRWWLVVSRDEVDLCLKDPGHEVDLEVTADIRAAVDLWMGYRGLPELLGSGAVSLHGEPRLVRTFADWFGFSSFRPVGDARSGREQPRSRRT